MVPWGKFQCGVCGTKYTPSSFVCLSAILLITVGFIKLSDFLLDSSMLVIIYLSLYFLIIHLFPYFVSPLVINWKSNWYKK